MAKAVKTTRRKRPDGSYYEGLCVDVWHRGHRINGNTGETTKAGVEKWLKDRKAEIDQRLAASRQSTALLRNLTVGTALARYLLEHLQFKVRKDWEPKEQEAARKEQAQRLLRLGSAIGTDVRLTDLSTAIVQDAVAKQLAAGKKPQTIKRELVTPLKAMHVMATEVWEHQVRPISWKRIALTLNAPKREIIPPTEEECGRLIEAATPRLAMAIMFALSTGFRLDEIYRARWDRFRPATDTQPATLTIIGKGAKEVTLPLNSVATSLVLSMQRGPSSRIFDRTNYRREWDSARRKAGLPGTRFHDLRHAFATLFQSQVKDPLALKNAMRHSDISTSLIYVHADKSTLSQSLEAVATKLKDWQLPLLPSPQTPSEEDAQLSFDFSADPPSQD